MATFCLVGFDFVWVFFIMNCELLLICMLSFNYDSYTWQLTFRFPHVQTSGFLETVTFQMETFQKCNFWIRRMSQRSIRWLLMQLHLLLNLAVSARVLNHNLPKRMIQGILQGRWFIHPVKTCQFNFSFQCFPELSNSLAKKGDIWL